jgi:hypothetical protein
LKKKFEELKIKNELKDEEIRTLNENISMVHTQIGREILKNLLLDHELVRNRHMSQSKVNMENFLDQYKTKKSKNTFLNQGNQNKVISKKSLRFINTKPTKKNFIIKVSGEDEDNSVSEFPDSGNKKNRPLFNTLKRNEEIRFRGSTVQSK